jgi:hypothetical protein
MAEETDEQFEGGEGINSWLIEGRNSDDQVLYTEC